MLFLRCVQGVGRAWIQSALQPVFLRHTCFMARFAPTSSRNCGPAIACSLPAAATVVNWSDDISHRPLVLSSCPASPRGLPLPLSPSPPPQLVTTRRLWLLSVWMTSVAWSSHCGDFATTAAVRSASNASSHSRLVASEQLPCHETAFFAARAPTYRKPCQRYVSEHGQARLLHTHHAWTYAGAQGHMLAFEGIC